MNGKPSQPKVLLVCNDDARSSVLEDILSEFTDLHTVRNLAEFAAYAKSGHYDVVFCGWSFQKGSWRDVLGSVHARFPGLPVIVFNHTGGEPEWAEVLRAGAFDLLIAPYWERGVLTVLDHALATYDADRIRGARHRQQSA